MRGEKAHRAAEYSKNSTLGAVGVVVLPSCPETEKRCVGELLDQRFLFFSVLVRE
jgi:hypothetical protein